MAQREEMSGGLGAVKVEVQVPGAGHADALHSIEARDERYKLFGNPARSLAQLLRQRQTAGQRNVSHFQVGWRIERGRVNLDIELRAYGLHKLGLYSLLNLR